MRLWLGLCPRGLLVAQALPLQLVLHARILGFTLAACATRSRLALHALMAWALRPRGLDFALTALRAPVWASWQ